MIYTAKSPRVILTIMFLVMLLTRITTPYEGLFIHLQTAALVVFFVALFVTYQFEIKSHKLTYQVFLMGMPIYTRDLLPKEIEFIAFKKGNWGEKAAIVKPVKGMPVRVIRFTPKDVAEKLETFADKHRIKHA